MEIWIFGNKDYAPDALPLKILPTLKKRFPRLRFITKDPNEDWDLPKKLFIIDTVASIKKITVYKTLDNFIGRRSLTMHDFDLGMKLKWLAKLKKLPDFLIIGLPMKITPATAIKQLEQILNTLDT